LRRRDFLKASSVGAGVTILEGCRAPEEQFIVQRVRQTPELPGQSAWRLGVCRQCAAGCGIQVRVVDGDAKKIEGNTSHPVNRGGVCALGHSLLQELYHPDRILQAQRRTGDRGAGTFEVMPWDDAIAQVVTAIGAVPSTGIAIVASDRTGLTGALWRRFAAALGAPAPSFLEAPELEVERRAAQLALGMTDYPYFDIARSDLVLSIGAPLLDRWRSPVHYTRAFADMRRARPTRRGRLIQAEARMSLSAANADEWLPIRPGTEGVLARAIGGILLESAGADAARRYRILFPGDAPTAAAAAAACDLPEASIVRVAEELAGSEAPVVIGGGSAAAHTNGLANVAAALGLNILLGSVGREGGVYAPASLGLARAIEPAGATDTPIADLAARIRGDAGAEPVDVLIVADADPVHALAGGWRIREGLARIGTIVALGSFRDETVLHADVVLPLATELERFEGYEPATAVGSGAFSVSEPVVEPLGEGLHPADILLEIARELPEPVASRFPWADYEALVRARIGEDLSNLPGSQGATATAYVSGAVERGGIFGEALAATTAANPRAAAPEPAAAVLEGGEGEYRFVLLPFESVKTAEGRGANRPWLQEHPDPMSTVMWNAWLEISPADASELGIEDDDLLRVDSPAGSIEVHAVIDPAVRPGVVSIPLGHGFASNGRYAQGRGANVMALIGSTLVEGTSASARASTRVRITRLGEGELVRFGRRYQGGEEEVIPVGWAPMDTTRPSREARV